MPQPRRELGPNARAGTNLKRVGLTPLPQADGKYHGHHPRNDCARRVAANPSPRRKTSPCSSERRRIECLDRNFAGVGA
jgi:hypothetical protein